MGRRVAVVELNVYFNWRNILATYIAGELQKEKVNKASLIK